MTDEPAPGPTRASQDGGPAEDAAAVRKPINILIFSDGTGQAGGLSPDQRLSNVYKLFRATRLGPDSPIDPAEQIAFYDPGLGTAPDAGRGLRPWVAVRKFAGSATGAGIGHNVADCYEAILRHWRPGDRIYLFGFSRGAYTARCVASVLRLCGMPTRLPDGGPVPRAGSGLRAVADEAVHGVYEHGAGRDRDRFEPERLELARRFRAQHAAQDASPYFIGVFDTVAALGVGGMKRLLMLALLLMGALLPPLLVAAGLSVLGVAPFWRSLGIGVGVVAAVVAIWLARNRLRIITRYPSKWQFRWHWSGWRSGAYDTNLDPAVPFARAALAIDETRADFRYVRWGQPSEGVRPTAPGDPERFQQVWFAGNHSDIGGSYPEDESRLSDIALSWMREQIESLPHPVRIDAARLRTFPQPRGRQHCEVESFLDGYPWWWPKALRRGWDVHHRREAMGAPHHPSVLQRFVLDEVVQCSRTARYRPRALEGDARYARFYQEAAGS